MNFDVSSNVRRLSFGTTHFTDEMGNKGLKGEIRLSQDPDMESMAIATSWKDQRKGP